MSNKQNCSTVKKIHKRKKDKQNYTDVDFESENKTEPSLNLLTECGKKRRHKKEKHKSDNDDELLLVSNCNEKEIVKSESQKQSKNEDHANKKGKTKDKEHVSETSYNADIAEEKIKLKKKIKKEKEEAVCVEKSVVTYDNSPPPSKKMKKNHGTESSFNIDASVSLENSESVYIQMMSKSKHEKKSKKQKLEMQDDTDVQTEDIRNHTENNNLSSVSEKGSNKYHKKGKKHSKNIDDTLSDAECKEHTKKHKGKSKERKKHSKNIDDTLSDAECKEHTKKHKGKSKERKKHSKNIDDTLSDAEHTKKHKDKSQSTYTVDSIMSKGQALEQVHFHKKRKVTNSDIGLSQDEMNSISGEQSNSKIDEESTKCVEKQLKPKDSSLSVNTKQVQDKHKLSNEINGDNSLHKNESDSTHLSKTAIQGQWQGDLFESSERQNKFLRLLGGMKKPLASTGNAENGTKKKGLFGSLASLTNTGSSARSNTAISVTAADSLNQKLEDEYNKAMNFKLNVKRGTGFGFVADLAEGKTFHIDVNKSKSIKFND